MDMKLQIKPLALYLAMLAASLSLDGARAGEHTGAGGAVDVLLVIALDVSGSVDAREFGLQREGLARALAAPQVAKAVESGESGAIAVTVVQWSGFTEQAVKIDWTRVSNAGDLARLAEAVRLMKRRYDNGATDIGGAITFCQRLFASAPYRGGKRVMDISGDGTNNVNHSPHFERDLAVEAGTHINALAIVEPDSALTEYFRDKVIGGPGAFVETSAGYAAFEDTMLRKLIREIGGQLLY